MMEIKWIQKRDGSKVPFDVTKIENAIYKALYACAEIDPQLSPEEDLELLSQSLGKKVVKDLSNFQSRLESRNEKEVLKEPFSDLAEDPEEGRVRGRTVEQTQDVVEQVLMKQGYFATAKAYILYREEHAKVRETTQQLSDRVRALVQQSKSYFETPLQEFVYYRTYSRWIEEEQRRETWVETVQRFMDFMRENLGARVTEKEYAEVQEAILRLEVMPSMRLLQFSGPPARRNHLCAYNCSFLALSCLRDLVDLMYVCMCGTGVGFSVEHKFISQFPKIQKSTGEVFPVHVVEDSKEGWCDAFHLGLETWFAGKEIEFDFSLIRPAGARLKTMGGKASGPEPLKRLLKFARETIAKRSNDYLTSLDLHDMACMVGQIVVAGGVRRCLAQGSRVKVPQGEKPIEQMKAGDVVWTLEGWKTVKRVWVQGKQPVIEIFYGEGSLKCTRNHRLAFGSPGNVVWKTVSEFLTERCEKKLIGWVRDRWTPVTIRKISKVSEEKETYDLEVEDPSCFVCEGILVHNSALISLSDLSDVEIRDCKKGEFWKHSVHRSMANNSAVYREKPDDLTFLEEWLSLGKSGTGERGIFNRYGLPGQIPKRRLDLLAEGYPFSRWREKWKPKIRALVGKELSELLLQWMLEAAEEVWKEDGNKLSRKAEKAWNEVLSKQPFLSVESEGICVCVQHQATFVRWIVELVEKRIRKATRTMGCNPCGEILLQSHGLCNLSTIRCRPHDTLESLQEKVRLATLLGTYQATLTHFTYVSPQWKEVAEKERLLGVSATGQWDCPIFRKSSTLRHLRAWAVEVNQLYSERFGITPATAVTTVKPEGTASEMLGTASGMHPRHAPYYLRRVRISTTDALFKMLRDQGVPYYPEVGQTAEDATMYVLEFPVKAPTDAITRHDLSAKQHLKYWWKVKTQYCEHNPSVTISIGPHEWMEVGHWILKHWDWVGGLSFLPKNDHLYPLAPFEDLDPETYEKRTQPLKHLDFAKILYYEKEDSMETKREFACTGDLCGL